MNDQDIIQLYWDRNQDAIRLTEQQYGPYCHAIARRILGSPEDADECVNDTWLQAWQAIPPTRPNRLSIWLGRITRNLSLNRLEVRQAQKRGGGQATVALEELASYLSENPVSGSVAPAPDDAAITKEIAVEISSFLRGEKPASRHVFIGRYYYFASIDEIAAQTGLAKSRVSVLLHRTRQRLMRHLNERGFEI